MQLEADDLCIEELRALPETFCRKHSVIPISKTDGKVTLVMSDPHNNLVIKEAEQFLGMTIRIMVATESSIHDCLDKVFASSR